MIGVREVVSWPALPGTEGALVMYAVHAFPADWPRNYVVRRLFVLPGGEQACDVVPRIANDLEQARELVPPCLYRQPRHESDAPDLLEVWF